MRHSRLLAATPCTLLAATVFACGGDRPVPVVEGIIDRETFIEAYVDLRASTVQGEELALPDEERDRILERHGVDEESLLAFVDAYGRELVYMNELWAEVERRFEALAASDEDGDAAEAEDDSGA